MADDEKIEPPKPRTMVEMVQKDMNVTGGAAAVAGYVQAIANNNPALTDGDLSETIRGGLRTDYSIGITTGLADRLTAKAREKTDPISRT